MKKRLDLVKLNEIRSLPAGGWEEVDCIICGKQTETIPVWPDRERGDIVRCHRCDLVYRSPRRREDDHIKHFKEEWTEARPTFQLEEYRSKNLRRGSRLDSKMASLARSDSRYRLELWDLVGAISRILAPFWNRTFSRRLPNSAGAPAQCLYY